MPMGSHVITLTSPVSRKRCRFCGADIFAQYVVISLNRRTFLLLRLRQDLNSKENDPLYAFCTASGLFVYSGFHETSEMATRLNYRATCLNRIVPWLKIIPGYRS